MNSSDRCSNISIALNDQVVKTRNGLFAIVGPTRVRSSNGYNQTPSEDRYPSIELNLKPILSFCLIAVPLGAVAQTRTASPPTMPDAQERLGTQYFEQKDYAAALVWYQKAANQGNADAQNDLGWLYQHALGVQQD